MAIIYICQGRQGQVNTRLAAHTAEAINLVVEIERNAYDYLLATRDYINSKSTEQQGAYA